MEIKNLRILNLILTILFVLLNIFIGEEPKWKLYQDISIIILIGGILDVYLHEIED